MTDISQRSFIFQSLSVNDLKYYRDCISNIINSTCFLSIIQYYDGINQDVQQIICCPKKAYMIIQVTLLETEDVFGAEQFLLCFSLPPGDQAVYCDLFNFIY